MCLCPRHLHLAIGLWSHSPVSVTHGHMQGHVRVRIQEVHNGAVPDTWQHFESETRHNKIIIPGHDDEAVSVLLLYLNLIPASSPSLSVQLSIVSDTSGGSWGATFHVTPSTWDTWDRGRCSELSTGWIKGSVRDGGVLGVSVSPARCSPRSPGLWSSKRAIPYQISTQNVQGCAEGRLPSEVRGLGGEGVGVPRFFCSPLPTCTAPEPLTLSTASRPLLPVYLMLDLGFYPLQC